MAVVIVSEHVCRCCQGLGEVPIEPGEYGYAPIYDDCNVCEGLGYETQDRTLEYQEDTMYHKEEL